MSVPELSEARKKAVCSLMRQAQEGEFAIVHQDSCCCKRGVGRCDCVPDVWRVTRAQA